MNILLLNAYFEPENIAYTHLETDLINGLIEKGHTIKVICPVPTRGISRDVAREYQKRKSESLYGGKVEVARFWAPQEGKNPLIRAFRYFWCNYKTGKIGKRQENVDVIFANSTPPTQGLVAVKVARKLSRKYGQKVPFVFNVQDIFPESLVNVNMANKKGVIWRIGNKISSYSYKNSDAVITISDKFKATICEKGAKEDKVFVVPNWIKVDDVFPVDKASNDLYERLSLDRKKFIVSYSGNIGHSQNLDLLIEAAKRLKVKNDDIHFLLSGEGACKEEVIEKIAELSLDNVSVHPYQPYEDIAKVFSLADVGLIISKPGIGKSSVPSKTWSIMAAKRPVLASFDLDSELSELILERKCGLVAAAGDVDAFENALLKLYNDSSMREEMAQSGFEYINTYLNAGDCVAKYVEIITSK